MRKQPHHMTETGSEDRIGNLTSIDRHGDGRHGLSAAPSRSGLMDDLAGEVIRLARLAAAMHMVESARATAVADPADGAFLREARP